MAIDIHDQPDHSYFGGYDCCDYTGDNFPVIPSARGFGWPEAFAIILVGVLLVPLVSWVAMMIAEAVA